MLMDSLLPTYKYVLATFTATSGWQLFAVTLMPDVQVKVEV